jgi:hypothetical protein
MGVASERGDILEERAGEIQSYYFYGRISLANDSSRKNFIHETTRRKQTKTHRMSGKSMGVNAG